ncbi:MAG: FkbM family methyltransferase [Eubacterium sp.]|nr:FkbM family methyltransferase [Eubacterium sp.]
MLELLSEKQNIWNFLANDEKPIVVYGMGNGAEKIISALSQYGAEVSDIFASDEFVRGHFFLGYKVMKYSEICEKYDDFNVVLAFASHLDDVIEKIRKINDEHRVFAPDVPIAGNGLFTLEFVKENESSFDFVYNHLADDESRKTYLDVINFKISGKVEYLLDGFYEKSRVYGELLCLCDDEVIVDLGAYDGDTIREFTGFTNGKYKHIYALEPDPRNFKKLERNTAEMKRLSIYNMGAWDKCDTLIFDTQSSRNSKLSSKGVPVKVADIDSLIDDEITMIKMDIEGAELHAIEGCKNTIVSKKPKLYICAYHRNEDLFAIPMKILSLRDDYKIYFRHSKYIPAWESNFYMV